MYRSFPITPTVPCLRKISRLCNLPSALVLLEPMPNPFMFSNYKKKYFFKNLCLGNKIVGEKGLKYDSPSTSPQSLNAVIGCSRHSVSSVFVRKRFFIVFYPNSSIQKVFIFVAFSSEKFCFSFISCANDIVHFNRDKTDKIQKNNELY